MLVGVAGDDAAARRRSAPSARRATGLDCRLVADPARPDHGQDPLSQRLAPVAPGRRRGCLAARRRRRRATCSSLAERRSAGAGALVLSDYAKGVLDEATIPALIALARDRGVPVIVDPKKADAAIFAGATLLTPNADEMARFAGMAIGSDAEAEAAGARAARPGRGRRHPGHPRRAWHDALPARRAARSTCRPKPTACST